MLAAACDSRGPADDREVELTISCGAVGQEFEICRQGVERWSASTGHPVKLVSTPNSATERLALYQQLLAAGASDIDVLQVDVIWPAILAPHLLDLGAAEGSAVNEHFPALVENNTVDGRLVALPWFADVGLLYYRRDLLEKHGEDVPTTWRELTDTAARIQAAERAAGSDRLWGYVWQGRAYEGLTCNALEWVTSHGGGTIVDGQGRVTINNAAAVRALEEAAGWVGAISPPGVLNYAEEESRGVFQSGQAVFMRNWPYAWALAQSEDSPVRGQVGVAPLPAGSGGRPAATLGGWQLAVSRYSRHPRLASELVTYLTGVAEQKRRAIHGAFQPTIPALYEDPEVLDANPFFARLAGALDAATPRPSAATGVHYNRVSNAFASAVHAVLSGERDAAEAVAALDRQLRELLGEGS
ncbi:MAG: ABC transporter substrate-binding protein [Gammaproteobacteria bacterium]